MTSVAMMIGMMPMALGFSEGSQQTAPLGRAVIGGLFLSTLATLFILPLVYTSIHRFRGSSVSSLDPDDPGSLHYG
jgi:multidrug efflux pump subunit AcrB